MISDPKYRKENEPLRLYKDEDKDALTRLPPPPFVCKPLILERYIT